MQITINDKLVDLTFGIGFVRELDKRSPVELKGLSLGMALQVKIPEILAGNIASLSDVIYCATFTNKNRPSALDVDNHIETLPDDELDLLFELVYEELEKSVAGKRVLKQLRENQQEKAQ